MAKGKNFAELEKKALELIKSKGSILQSDLWKILNLDSRDGSRLVLKLVKKGMVERELVQVNGRKTYKLTIKERRIIQRMKGLHISLESTLDVPCTTCKFLQQCGPGNFYSPATCTWMDDWLEKNARQVQLVKAQEISA